MTLRRKDQGWAWLVALSACISRALYDGFQKAISVLLPTLSDEFNQDIWVIGLTVSLMTIVGGIAAIVTGLLTSALQPGRIVMLCGVLSCIGISCCALASNWITCGIFLVVLTGIPMRIAWVVLLSSLSDYFDEYYPVANCIAFTGSAFGIAVFAPLTQFFLDSYGWRGAMVLLGSISLHLVVCGAVLKTPPDENKKYTKITDSSHAKCENKQKTENGIIRILKRISDKLELHHFENPAFLTCLITVFALGYSAMGWVTYLVPYAENRGISPYHATSLSTAGGIGHFFGFIILAAILQTQINPIYVLTIGTCISGTAMMLYPISDRMSILLIISFTYGFSNTSYLALLSVCNELTGGHVTQSIAWLSLVSAVGKGFSGFMTGWIFDTTGSYNVAFVTLGGVLLSAALVLGVTIFTTHKKFKRKCLTLNKTTK